jgi:hypothetical protein
MAVGVFIAPLITTTRDDRRGSPAKMAELQVRPDFGLCITVR